MYHRILFMRAAVFAAAVFVFSLGAISCDELIREKGIELQQLEEEIRIAEEKNDRLHLEAASLSSPQSLERIAKEELGMVKAEETDFVFYVKEKETSAKKEKDHDGGGIFGAVSRLW